MSSSTSKKRTLSEQKETDVVANKCTDSGENKEENTENATKEIDTLRTFIQYLEAKNDTPENSKVPMILDQEWEELEEEWKQDNSTPVPMDVVLNRLHSILVSASTQEEVERIANEIDIIIQEAEENEDEEESIKKAQASRIQEFLKQEVEQLNNEIKKKDFGKAFDLLIAITHGGCIANGLFWFEQQKEGKAAIEEIFHGVTEGWTHLLTKADKFCHDHISLSDKHFIYAMMDRLKARADENGYKWTFHKTTLSTPQPLNWDTEQKKYNVEVVYKTNYNEESENQSNSEENENEDEEEEEEEQEENDGEGEDNEGDDGEVGDDENGETGPPAKRRKL